MVDERPELRLTPRDRLLFEHVLRYGVTTVETTHQLFTKPEGLASEAARSLLRRLTGGGYFNDPREPWPHFRLAERAVTVIEPLLGVAPGTYKAASHPLARNLLLERMTILMYCCLGGKPRRVLLQHELERYFGDYVANGVPSWPYMIEQEPDGSVLQLLMIDSQSGLSEQLNRVTKQHQRRVKIEALRELELRGRFRVTLLTAFERRAEELRLTFDDATVSSVDVVVVPQAVPLFTEVRE